MQSSQRIDELRQKFHENPRRYFAPLANEYRKAGDPEQAIAICRAHLAQQPGHMSGHVVYGQALYDARRMDEANLVFQQALALDPENIVVLRHLGDIARQRGDVEEARTWYSRALDGDPQDAEIAAYLAELTEPLTIDAQSEEEAPQEAVAVADAGQQYEPNAEPAAEEAETEQVTAEAEALAEAESEGFAAPELTHQPETAFGEALHIAPEPEAEIETEPQPDLEPETRREMEPEGEREIEAEDEFKVEAIREVDRTEGTADFNEPLLSPYAREMDRAAPPEMKWDLNDSPYLEPAEPSASDEAWDSVRDDPEVEGGATTDSAEKAVEVPVRKTPSRATPVSEVAPIVTRTLAELYLQQGHIEPALEIYRQLAEREPADVELQARINELSSEGEPDQPVVQEPVSPEAPVFEPAPLQAPGAEAHASEAQDEEAPVASAAPAVEPDQDERQVAESPPVQITEDEATPIDADSTPRVNGESFTEPEQSDQLWDSADSWGDWPFAETGDRDEIFGLPEDTGPSLPQPDERPPPEAEAAQSEPAVLANMPEVEAEPTSAASGQSMTVREFFATLGSVRPPSHEADRGAKEVERPGVVSEPAPHDKSTAQKDYQMAGDAFANLFPGVPVAAEDSRAAAALSGAVAHGVPLSTSPASSPSRPTREVEQSGSTGEPGQESEEDIRRFREWLDGLAGS